MLFVLFLIAEISHSLLFFMLSSSRRIDASTLSFMFACSLPPSFIDTYSLRHLWDVRP